MASCHLLDQESQAELHYHRALLLKEQGDHDLALSEAKEAAKDVRIPLVRSQIRRLLAALGA